MTGSRVRALLLAHWQESLLLLLLGPLALYFALSNSTSESLPLLDPLLLDPLLDDDIVLFLYFLSSVFLFCSQKTSTNTLL